jgi:hypothetical protein
VKIIVSILIAGAFLGCSSSQPNQSTPEPQRSSKLPTATEVFNLRTKCAQLGREVDEYMFHGPVIDRETLSNYSIKSNRCYVTLDDHNGSPGDWHRLRGLYDGQTREELAYAEYFTKRQSNGQNTNGHIYSEGYNGPCGDKDDCGFSKADAYIDERMKRDE